jgi:molybdopterin converting factor small subunit
MKVKVKLIGPLMYEAGFNEKDIEAPDGTTVGDLLNLVAIAKERPKIVIRNGKSVAPEELLQEGDKISVSPIYSGG